MKLPPQFLDDLRSRLSLSDVVGRKVTWDRRKSQPGKGDFWAPCPFHQEKTASFHADDRKGFYHCFGCGASGDLFKFVMETENIGFSEAVERLASEAGVAMPERQSDPVARAAEDRRKALFDVMEEAVRVYRRLLASNAGQVARDYIARRGLAPEIVSRFELGFAPEGGVLARHVAEKGQLEAAVEAGLVLLPDEDGGRARDRAPFDRFRNRLMFPIRDARGRCIAFGGRALSDGQQAKYLNSPETPLFSKGRNLYHAGPARAAAAKAGTVIVAEGYMDVIALAGAGFDHAVAPLGTAMTADQLTLLWRMAGEPVIALDGDVAGLRAAHKAVDLALPMLAPGRSLGFCLMPEGKDPDDVIGEGGPPAMQTLLDRAVPLIEMLWRRELAAGPLDTPERRADFDRRLRVCLERIEDRSVRDHYRADLAERRRALFRPAPQPGPMPVPTARQSMPSRAGKGTRFGARGAISGPAPQTRASSIAVAPPDPMRAREATILLIAWHYPPAVAEMAGDLEELLLHGADLEAARGAVLSRPDGATGNAPPAALAAIPQARCHPLVAAALAGRPAAPDDAVAELHDLMARHALALARQAALGESAAEIAAEQVDLGRLDLDDALTLTEGEQTALMAACGGMHERLSTPVIAATEAYAVEQDDAAQPEEAVAAWERLLDEIGMPRKKL
ncbi:MAG: DNA primase [Pseudomonadota bacterium]